MEVVGAGPRTLDEGERFEIQDVLGVGAMGVVYRAYDRIRRGVVALKILRRFDASLLYLFKQEFRSLQGVVHPNLVTLYELHTLGETWCFSMELIDGVPFLQHVRPHHHLMEHARPPTDPRTGELIGGSLSHSTVTQLAAGPAETDAVLQWQRDYGRAVAEADLRPRRLRAALPQLVEGIAALHEAGKLHRDLKPSNVLVDTTGRVVICDFGLVLDRGASAHTTSDGAGTPAYMSPEQALGQALDEASDWYSVGVLLFKALTGRLPFGGTSSESLERKRSGDIDLAGIEVPPRDADLLELAIRLMHPDPRQRPTGEAIAIAVAPSRPGPRRSGPVSRARIPFVGREPELEALEDAFATVHQGHSAAVFVGGRSGIGKTALVQSFLERVQQREAVLLLQGRCYPRESVPHKALDSLVDALSSVLLQYGLEQQRELLDREVASLARLFPVLRRVPAIAAGARDVAVPKDPLTLRARAFDALRRILTRLAERQPTVLFIDDLQWGDADSASFLVSLLDHYERPPALFVATYRSDDAETTPWLSTLLAAARSTAHARVFDVDALSADEAARLAERMLEAGGERAPLKARRIAEEAGGHPFLVAELAEAAASRTGTQPSGVLDLDEVLIDRIRTLPPEASKLLVATSIAGRPLPSAVLSKAAAIVDESSAIAMLDAQRLIRIRSVDGTEWLEPYHDRIREAVASSLPELRVEAEHRRLAETLEEAQPADPVVLVELWLGAGERERAATYAPRAASRMEEAMAFGRAAHYYGLALELDAAGTEPSEHRRALLERMGEALVLAGTLRAAAEAFQAAAEGAERRKATDLRRRAFEAYLRAGLVSEGVALAERVLEAVGIKMPRNYRYALLSVILTRLWLRVRGFGFRPRPPEEVDPEAVLRIDVCWSISSGMSFVNAVYGTAFQTKLLAYALESGDAERTTRALCLNVGFESAPGPSARLTRYIARTRRLVAKHGDAGSVGFWRTVVGLARFLTGRFRNAVELLETGERQMLEHDARYRWQADLSVIFQMAARLYLGQVRELVRLVPMRLRDADERGDHFLAVALRAWRTNFTWLALDRADEALEHAKAIEPITKMAEQFHQFHFYEMVSRANIELYRGEVDAALDRVERCWRPLQRSLLLRIHATLVEGGFLRARCALAALRAGHGDADALRKIAKAMSKRLRRTRGGWAVAQADLVDASLAHLAGEVDRTVVSLRRAIAGFERADMALHRNVAKSCLGTIIGGDEGELEMTSADAWMRSEGIVAPERIARLLAPAFFEPRR